MQSIKKLPESVVNRIAAGEVVHRPAAAIKEMIENSIDAKATQITISVKDGGLKMFCVQDNGAGINRNDLDILCNRFTTSKLIKFEDLQHIDTYGFRGEALASISHVSHMTVVTKTENSPCAYKTCYLDGDVIDKPKGLAGQVGTNILVEDIFYNLPVRRTALRSSEEFARIREMVMCYAAHNFMVAFCLRKVDENVTELRTTGGSDCSIENTISIIFGSKLVDHLMPFSLSDHLIGLTDVNGFISGINANTQILKRFRFIVFINHRLVECPSLKRSLEALYTNYLAKHSHPFVFLSMQIKTEHIDVNVHPTKQEVRFLFESEILAKICEAIEKKLVESGSNSRTFTLPTSKINCSSNDENGSKPECNLLSWMQQEVDKKNNVLNTTSSSSNDSPKIYDHQLIRTDGQNRSLTEFYPSQDLDYQDSMEGTPVSKKMKTIDNQLSNDEKITEIYPIEQVDNEYYREIKLTSILELQSEICSKCNLNLREMIRSHSFIGCVDPRVALFQYETSLYLTNTEKLAEELFYQMILFKFGNLGGFSLTEPINIDHLIERALTSLNNSEKEMVDDEFITYGRNILLSKSTMLWDYFSLEINADGMLTTLPMLLDVYCPQIEGLPVYIYRLIKEVDWTSEKTCFQTFARITAQFYSPKRQFCDKLKFTSMTSSTNAQTWKQVMFNLIYPTIKKRLLPPDNLVEDGYIRKLTDLHELYKTFERC